MGIDYLDKLHIENLRKETEFAFTVLIGDIYLVLNFAERFVSKYFC